MLRCCFFFSITCMWQQLEVRCNAHFEEIGLMGKPSFMLMFVFTYKHKSLDESSNMFYLNTQLAYCRPVKIQPLFLHDQKRDCLVFLIFYFLLFSFKNHQSQKRAIQGGETWNINPSYSVDKDADKVHVSTWLMG